MTILDDSTTCRRRGYPCRCRSSHRRGSRSGYQSRKETLARNRLASTQRSIDLANEYIPTHPVFIPCSHYIDLSTHHIRSSHPLNPHCQPTFSSHCLTPIKPTLPTHPPNPSSQPTLSTHPINPSPQPILSTYRSPH